MSLMLGGHVGVQPCARQGDDSPNYCLRCEDLVEEDNGRADDSHALYHVAHAMRHRTDALQCVERKLRGNALYDDE